MKKRKTIDLLLFFVLGIGVGIAFGMSSALLIRHNRKEEKKEYKYEITGKSNCQKEVTLYYKENDRDIYLYCLNSIKVSDGNNLYEFKNYIKDNPDGLEEMFKELTVTAQYKDGGSILYRDNEELSLNGFSVLKCSTSDDNKDIYIGPKGMVYEEGFCLKE